jgi:hypothetical protein
MTVVDVHTHMLNTEWLQRRPQQAARGKNGEHIFKP